MQVTELSRALAVHTMQLQMEYVASSLEDEALDLAERSHSTQLLLNRQVQKSQACFVAPACRLCCLESAQRQADLAAHVRLLCSCRLVDQRRFPAQNSLC